ncbi:MAG: hypothetical protein HY532_09355, partial [Chloroflexi bacterium]|nr:hypothetical protein [Chloroflexota bacterium]
MNGRFWKTPSLGIGVLASLGLLTAVACGGGTTEPTATATTGPAPTATATSDTGAVSTPTPSKALDPTPTATPSTQPKQGGIIRRTRTDDVPNWDSHVNASSSHSVLGAKLQSQLIWNPKDQELVEDAAESYSISADGKVWTFKLRPNIKYHSYNTPTHPRDGTT